MSAIVITLLCLAPGSGELLDRAVAASEAGDHVTAAILYEQVRQQGIDNGLLALNEGNAHLLAGQLPQAILAYRRAERFIPNDPRLRENLAEARRQVLDPPPRPTSWLPEWLPWPGRSTQVILALCLWVLGWGLGAWALFKPSRSLSTLAAATVVLALLFAGSVWLGERRDREQPVGVIASDGVVLREGNGTSYPPIETNGAAIKLNRGVELRVLAERKNGWLRIVLADGRTGWAPRAEILIDQP